MTPTAWFDPLIFSLTVLCGGSALLSLELAWAAGRRGILTDATRFLLGLASLAAGLFAITAFLQGQVAAIWGSATIFVGLYGLLVVAPSPLAGRCAAAVLAVTRRRRCRSALSLTIGAASPFVGLGLAYAALPPMVTLDNDGLAALVADRVKTVDLEPSNQSPLTTDRGRTVPILLGPHQARPSSKVLAAQAQELAALDLNQSVICLALGWQDCNCHGFVFTGGQYWVSGDAVGIILEDNQYKEVGAPQAGDIAMYRNDVGQIVHTGIVRGLSADGLILTESKWGCMGRFIHRHDQHPYADSTCTFYRSPRPGHLLLGVGPSPMASSHEVLAPHATEPSAGLVEASGPALFGL
jgi:hypothetical protein